MVVHKINYNCMAILRQTNNALKHFRPFVLLGRFTFYVLQNKTYDVNVRRQPEYILEDDRVLLRPLQETDIRVPAPLRSQ